MPRAVVIYTTRFGNTEKASMAIYEGLREYGLNCDCKSIVEVTPGDTANYDVVLFEAPTHANGIPDEMGEFMESVKKVKLSGETGAAFDTRYEDAEVGGLNVLESYMKKFGIRLLSLGLVVFLPKGAYKGPLRENELVKC